MKDSHYTPEVLSKKLLNYFKFENIKTIADFCVGNGALLESAQKIYNNAEFFGSDISDKVLSRLKKLNPHWNLSRCDFTNSKSRNSTNILKNRNDGFDLILMNPPFTCRGGTIHKVELNNKYFSVSTSMLFIVESLKYLSENGVLLAILPVSVAYSQKDRLIWNKLVEDYKLNILHQPSINHFKDCSPSIILVSINTNKTNKLEESLQNNIFHTIEDISLFRGKISMYKVKDYINDGPLFIHTTNLRNNRLVNLNLRLKNPLSEISGPAVLIPRVGLPNPEKMTIINHNETYTASDCIIGLKTKTLQDSKNLFNLLQTNWKSFKNLYRGTGAKYITLEKLGKYLNLSEKQYTIASLSGTFTIHTEKPSVVRPVKEPSSPSHHKQGSVSTKNKKISA